MKYLHTDILSYTQYTISIFILLQMWSSHQTYLSIQEQYSTITKEAVLKEVSSKYINDVMWLNESFRRSLKKQNADAAPFLALIKSSDSRDLRSFKKDILFAINKTSDGHYEPKLWERSLLTKASHYPKLANYVKEYFYHEALLSVGTLYVSCCFCLSKYQPLIEETKDNYIVYPNYYEDRPTFSKILVNGEELERDKFTWTPKTPGSYLFEVEHRFIDDDQRVSSVSEQFTLIAE